jgi:erythromycin esterase-like protein
MYCRYTEINQNEQVKIMDNSIGLQIKRLIEIDRKAVELAAKREVEFQDLEEKHNRDKERVNSLLQLAKEEAKKHYSEQLKLAQDEAAAMSAKLDKRILEIEKAMSQVTDELAEEIWQGLLEDLK